MNEFPTKKSKRNKNATKQVVRMKNKMEENKISARQITSQRKRT